MELAKEGEAHNELDLPGLNRHCKCAREAAVDA